jgi:DNA uptake protein ComE-like DNA-binding protein
MKQWRELTSIAVMAMLLVMGFAPRSGVGSQVGKNTGVLNPNLAGEKELLALPHLNAKLVKEILSKRPFLSMAAFHAFLSDLLNKEQTAELYAKLFIPINLNIAAEEEILLIPGVGKRLAHEFEEYRPYRALAQFRREIGKYVDEKEVARLEQYVFVPVNLNTASDADILSIPGVGKRLLHEFKEYRP